MREKLEQIIQEQIMQDILEEVTLGEWSSPAILVRKSGNNGMRLVIDYRGLNSQTIDQVLVIPRTDSILDDIGQGQPRLFSTLDLEKCFHQMNIHSDSRQYTAFTTPHGKYQYKRLPIGLKNSLMPFQLLMNQGPYSRTLKSY